MPQICSQPLRPNPFETYRDPVTGQWVIVYPASSPSVRPQPSTKRQLRQPAPQPAMAQS